MKQSEGSTNILEFIIISTFPNKPKNIRRKNVPKEVSILLKTIYVSKNNIKNIRIVSNRDPKKLPYNSSKTTSKKDVSYMLRSIANSIGVSNANMVPNRESIQKELPFKKKDFRRDMRVPEFI